MMELADQLRGGWKEGSSADARTPAQPPLPGGTAAFAPSRRTRTQPPRKLGRRTENTHDTPALSRPGRIMVRHLCLPLAVLHVAPASAKNLLLCKAPGQRDVTISLQDQQFRDRTLDCIPGDFVSDLTPCAPPGGYGLLAPTGSAPLGQVVNRWQDYGDHSGGMVGHGSVQRLGGRRR